MKIINQIKRIKFALIAIIIALSGPISSTWADSEISFALSPMNQSIVLNPGDTYHGSFKLSNPNSSISDLEYEIEKKSFYVDESYGTTFDEVDGPIVAWTTLESASDGVISPNSTIDIKFTIDVPDDAVGGGQYEAFLVKTKLAPIGDGSMENGAGISEQLIMVHLVFAEIAGDITRQGEVIGIDLPSLLLSGNIIGSAAIKNTGNIHSEATYTLQVFPLFSDEEIFTNVESPDTHIILPDRTFYNETVWKETPEIGIFNVIYTVEFAGVTTQVSKLVIKCPIWLLFIIFAVIAGIIIWLVMRMRARGKKSRKTSEAKSE